MATAEPLTADIETGGGDALKAAGVNLPPEPELKGALKPVAETTPKERAAGIVAGIAVITALVAIIIEQSAIVVIAGLLSSVMGPYAYYQQTRLTNIATLKETAAAVQVEVDKLEHENDRLKSNIKELGGTIEDLNDVEAALDKISSMQGQSVAEFEKQVHQAKDLLKTQKGLTKGKVLNNLSQLVFRGDADKDKIFSESEVTNIIESLKKIGGVTIHEDRFRAALVGKHESAVMEIFIKIKDGVPKEERIFEFNDE